MNIGDYTYEEFIGLAERFHGYPAPGLIVAAYMAEAARGLVEAPGNLNAIAETGWCLPDALQLLTGCTLGNGRLKVFHLGLYALSLYDRRDGRGVRVWVAPSLLEPYPELKGWFLKLRPKKEQDSEALFAQVREAGGSICQSREITVRPEFLAKRKKGGIAVCPLCREAYPESDGGVCRYCQGESPYVEGAGLMRDSMAGPPLAAVPAEQAVGRRALHDMTMIVPGVKKGAEFERGHEISCSDLTRLKSMGRRTVYIEDGALPGDEWVHEDEAADAFGRAMAGDGVEAKGPPREGKITLAATRDGLFLVDAERLRAFNFIPDVMCACRRGFSLVKAGTRLAGSRAIPLYLRRELFERCMSVLAEGPLFRVAPLRRAKVGVLVTGTEVYEGTVADKFQPIIEGKVMRLGCEVVKTVFVPDDREKVRDGALELIAAGSDLVVTTAGLSVDPDDVTRAGLIDAGAKDILYGAPMLPGAMTLLATIGPVQVIGVPACALFFKTTSFDALLPRLLAGAPVSRRDLAALADGGMCLECKDCTYPKCSFAK